MSPLWKWKAVIPSRLKTLGVKTQLHAGHLIGTQVSGKWFGCSFYPLGLSGLKFFILLGELLPCQYEQ